MPDFMHLLILMVVIWTAGRLFKYFRLPEVFGELLGGIVVGPAMLGIVDGESEVIAVIAELGIFFLMVHTGLKMDPEELAKASTRSFVIGLGSMLLPLAGGYMAARWMGMAQIQSLFMGLSFSISALPLAARLFKDAKLEHTSVAHASLGAAIVVDVLGLVLFSVLVGVGEDGVDWWALGRISLSVVTFFVGVVVAGMLFHRYLSLIIKRGNRSFTVTLILTLCIGMLAEAAGLHMVIGAFLAGLFIREEVLDREVFARIEDRYYALTYGFFGPIFFASLAFHFDLAVLRDAPLELLGLTAVAVATKLVGSGGAALLAGMSARESVLAGVALNTRGAVELIIASVGLRMGLIDTTTFSLLVMVAFVATILSLLAAPWATRGIRTA
jgi:Kef-type K+ transport system membrane component KefB